MKIVRKFILIISVVGMTVLISCGKKDGDSSYESIQLKQLTATWKVIEARKGGVLQTGYDNCILTFSGSASDEVYEYSVSGIPEISPWTSIGSWTFGSDNETQIIRDPNTLYTVEMDYVVSKSSLQLAFEYEVGSVRSESANGFWTFTFIRQ